MYRQYEDPGKVQKMLDMAIAELEELQADPSASVEAIADAKYEVDCLKDRLNFAWQDEEYDEMNATY